MKKITPVLLAGGTGSRLWPMSRKSYPKQFIRFFNNRSLFQQTVLRFGRSRGESFLSPIIFTNSEYRFIASEQMFELGPYKKKIIIEPETKNTSPSILAACIMLLTEDPEAILLVAPSDHLIKNDEVFHMSVMAGMAELEKGDIVTFGVKPTHPETGYGYIETLELKKKNTFKVGKFVEKPPYALAEKMLETGRFLWNSGIFLFRARDMLSAFEKHANSFLEPVRDSIKDGFDDLDFFNLDKASWSKIESSSIDFEIMEKINNIVTIPIGSDWTDLGDWGAVSKMSAQDENGNVLSKNSIAVECTDTMLRSESKSQQIVGIGLEDIIAIAMPDAVLISHKNDLQKVKDAVSLMKNSQITQGEMFPKEHRPWGWFETLLKEEAFHLKRIYVKSRESLSLQKHKYRSEHWVVVTGKIKVTLREKVFFLEQGESVYIPCGSKHRLENCESVPAVVIEVQTGKYFGEDDIIRYEDKYARK